MRRREFITLLGCAAAAWPLSVRAQHGAIPIVGYLSGASSDSLTAYPAVFRRSLAEAGYVEGQNMEIEYRWAGDQPDRLPALATELVSRKVTILYTVSNAAAYAAKAATSTIPTVFLTGGDPVECCQPQSTGRQRYRRNPVSQ
jgi:putative tryptophan/tyrosine transport system substrate-binding protein